MRRTQRLEGLSAKNLAKHVEKPLLDGGFDRRYVKGHVDKSLCQLRRQLAGEYWVEQRLHVFAQSLAHSNGKAANAVEDRVNRASLPGADTEALAHIDEHPVQIGGDGALNRVGNVPNGKECVISLLLFLKHG